MSIFEEFIINLILFIIGVIIIWKLAEWITDRLGGKSPFHRL